MGAASCWLRLRDDCGGGVVTDRELLELAAPLAGRSFEFGKQWHDLDTIYVDGRPWNPLTDDGDALRLAVKLEIDIKFYRNHVDAIADKSVLRDEPKGFGNLSACSEWSKDRNAATRRAIVRAAAEIAKAQP